jgi:aldose 1-epimerase
MMARLITLLMATAATGASAHPVRVSSFGRIATGEVAHLFTLTNEHGLIVRISDWGGLLTAVEAPDSEGHNANVALGFATVSEYEAHSGVSHFGGPVGRYVNRIAGAHFDIDGREVRLVANDGPDALHSGAGIGYDQRLWTASTFDKGASSGVVLSLVSPAGDQGFPGTLLLTLTYALNDDNELSLTYRATSDAATALNLTSHSYFNLSGAGRGDVLDETLEVVADSIAELGERKLPTGRLVPVSGGFDLRRPRKIGEAFKRDPVLEANGGYDHPFVLADAPRAKPAFAARLSDPASGRMLDVFTTEPAIQVYTGNGLGSSRFGAHGGIALETEHLPDSVHHADFPTTLLRPGQTFTSTTIYRFSASRPNSQPSSEGAH